MSLSIHLPKFEGPLALLLYLIRKEEMDIMDIQIHEITSQYLEYVKSMKELDLEMAGEFVAMAASLIQIKSKMLLPQYDENGEPMEVEDPRKELVQRLLEYQKYQEAAKMLYERPLLGRDFFARGVREKLEQKEEEIHLEENALFALISAYKRAISLAQKRIHKVAAKVQSIASRILEMKDRLILGQRVVMNDLIEATENKGRQILITFLSLLELGKMGFVSLYQSEPYADIWIDLKKNIEDDVITRVEEYDNIHSAELAEKMIHDAEEELEAGEQAETPAMPEPTQINKETQETDFVLRDREDYELEGSMDNLTHESDDLLGVNMATDEDIFRAEEEEKLNGEV